MSKYMRVRENLSLIRDPDSRAVLNTDNHSLNKYKEERDFKMKLNKVVQEHEQLKSDISEIKSLLIQALQQR